MITIILLFSIAAGFGIVLLVPILQDKSPSRPFVFIHGGIAATALVMLLLRFFKENASVPSLSVILFVIAAIGGLVLFARDMQNKALPKGLALIHAGAAVVALLILLFSAM